VEENERLVGERDNGCVVLVIYTWQLLLLLQTLDLNLKALVLANEINWKLYENIAEETVSYYMGFSL